jgi:hypothetical protein
LTDLFDLIATDLRRKGRNTERKEGKGGDQEQEMSKIGRGEGARHLTN